MTYRVLARKWRPANFSELVGQTHVLRALQNALEQGRIHHAYLLTGTRGVGKTTIARILARCFNCEKGMSANPCGECPSCLEIAEGRSLDLIEVDAASRTKVEDTRELLENSQFAPSHGRYKIYLIDEVHMLSNHSFNALLKTLEEPPEHVIFIFATTHPQKIPVTVLSRCLQFHLKNISGELIGQHLDYILKEEKVVVEEKALALIAHAAQGSMRDALSITEQAIAFGEGTISSQQVGEMLGVVDHQIALQILESTIEGEAAKALSLLAEFATHTADFSLLLDSLMQLLHRISLEQLLKGAGTAGQLHGEGIEKLALRVDPSMVQIFYQALLNGKRDLSYAPDPLTGTEMILSRMLAFRPAIQGLSENQGESNAAVNLEQTSGERGSEQLKKFEASPSDANQNNTAKTLKSEAQKSIPNELPVSFGDDSMSNAAPIESNSKVENSIVDNEVKDLASFSNQAWCDQFVALPLSGLVRAVAEHFSWQSSNQGTVLFFIAKEQSTLYSIEHDKRIAQGLSIYFGQPITVRVEVCGDENQGSGLMTPAIKRYRSEKERQAKAVDSIENDLTVKKILHTFDASIEYDSIQPGD